MTNKKKLVIISTVTSAVLILLMILLLSSCKGNTENTSTADEIIGTSVQTVTQVVTDAQGSTQIQEATEVINVKADGTVEKAEDVTKPTEKETNDDNKKLVPENGSSSSKTTSDNSSNNNTSNNSSAKVENQNKPQNNKPNTNTNSNSNSSSATSKPSGNSSTTSTSKPSGGNTAPTTSSTTSKVWHEAVYEYIEHPAVTEQVWVVDKEAYTYEETICEKQGRTFCNNCGEDITDNRVQHTKNHALNGEPGSYHDEWVKVAVGTEIITVPEQGHYETKIVKEAYTEKKLIKEAGYY